MIDTVTPEQIGKAAAELEIARRESNAGAAKAIFRDKEGKAMFAIIIAAGIPETDEVVSAIEEVEKSWEDWEEGLP